MSIDRLTKADHPQAFGAYKPVGHVVVALPDSHHAAAAVQALHEAGFAAEDILQYTAAEQHAEMTRMLADVGNLASFGYEVKLMHKYIELADKGACWLTVYAPEDEQAQQVADTVRRHGAWLAEKYNRLTVEDLIQAQ